MSLKLLPPPRVWQKTAPVFGGRTVPRPLPHHPTDPRHLWGKIMSQGGNYGYTRFHRNSRLTH